jgi:hypothetical protein
VIKDLRSNINAMSVFKIEISRRPVLDGDLVITKAEVAYALVGPGDVSHAGAFNLGETSWSPNVAEKLSEFVNAVEEHIITETGLFDSAGVRTSARFPVPDGIIDVGDLDG